MADYHSHGAPVHNTATDSDHIAIFCITPKASRYIYPSTRSCAFPSKRGRDSVCLRFGARSVEGEKKVAMEVVKGKEEAPADVSLKQLSKKLDDFAQERDWEKHHSPRNLLLAMVGEVGELSELFMWKGEVQRGLPGWDEAEKEHLGEELSDVLLYLIRLSDMCGVDLGDAALKKIVKNAVKYPAPSKSA